MWVWALLRTVRVNTHPVWTSVRFRVRANSPFNVGPQCATVSPSKNPGSASTSSPALRIVIDERSSGEGFVVVTPRIWSMALAGLRYRSIDAALMDSSSSRTAMLYRSTPNTSSRWRSSPSSWVRIDTARYFPHCPPEAAHTFCSTFTAS